MLKALSLMRTGRSLTEACQDLRVAESTIASLHTDLESVPDAILFTLERLSDENAALRQSIAQAFTRASYELRLDRALRSDNVQ